MKNIYFLPFLILLTLFACRKDIDETSTKEEQITPPIITVVDYTPTLIEVIATLHGEVFNENGSPLSNVNVNLDDNNTTTDDKGRFIFKNIVMNQAGTYVEANQNGYFPGSDRFFPEDVSVNYTKITLLEKEETGSFMTSDGGLISSPEGISIDFPANGVVTAAGELYQGEVSVAARWIDPTADNLQEIMPGGLQGIMEGGANQIGDDYEEVALASFGMMVVELEGSNGEALNLGNEQKATLSFPVPTELLGNAPNQIPLWYFNEELGLWVEEGSATLQGDMYVGDVAHFSFWNCDAPFDVAKICGSMVNNTGSPLANTQVKIKLVSSGEVRSGWTNNDGLFSGKVPANELLELYVLPSNCNEIFVANIGPIAVSQDTSICQDIGTFTITNPSLIDITANVLDCSGSPVTNGWLEINIGGNETSYYIDDGNNISMTIYNCDNQTELTTLASNLDDLEASALLTYTITNPLDLGNISACGSELPEFITITADGVETTMINVQLSIFAPLDSMTMSGNIPGTSFYVGLSLANVSSTGVYSEANSTIYMDLESSTGDNIIANCYGGNLCGFDNIEITQYGNPGEVIRGTFSGPMIQFLDSGSQPVVTPVTAEFKIIRN